MRNQKIGETLKKYRKLKGYQVHDVAVILRDKYQLDVADKTIYGWESNQAHPTSDMFLIICEIYEISNITGMFLSEDDAVSDFAISPEERSLIEAYREHPQLKEAVQRILKITKSSSSTQKQNG